MVQSPLLLQRRSLIVVSAVRGSTSSRCRAVWAFAADRFGPSHAHPSRRRGSRCPRYIPAAVAGYSTQPAALRPRGPSPPAAAAAAASEAAGAPAAPSSPPPDPDAVLDGFTSAFGLPRHQLRIVLERQPALARVNPVLLAGRIAAYTRATGLSTYQLLYIVTRQPAFLQLTPAELVSRCAELGRALALGQEDVLQRLVSQPTFLEFPPEALRVLSGRVGEELKVRPSVALRVMAGLPPRALRNLLGLPAGSLTERMVGLRQVLQQNFGSRSASTALTLLLVTRCPPLLALPNKAVAATLAALMTIPPTKVRARTASATARRAAAARVATTGGSKAGAAAVAAVAAASGGAGSGVLDMLVACPYVLTLPPEMLRGRFIALAAAMRIDMPAVVTMLFYQPRLLLVEPAKVRDRLEGLTFSLMVPRSAALDMVVRQPQLLLYQTEKLAENWAALQQLLGVTFEATLSMVTRHPNLLCSSPANLNSKVVAFEALFALPRARAILLMVQRPALLTLSERRYKYIHRTLASLVPLQPAALGRLVCREPYLLMEDSVKLASKVNDAATLLGLTDADVGNMLSRAPEFITKDFRYWQTNFDTIVSGLCVSKAKARATAFRFPALLADDPAELHQASANVMSLVRTSPRWLEELEGAKPEAIFKCLRGSCGNKDSWEHLQFLVDSKLQARQRLLSELVWDRPAFLQRYPLFADWQAAHRAASTAPNGLPLRSAFVSRASRLAHRPTVSAGAPLSSGSSFPAVDATDSQPRQASAAASSTQPAAVRQPYDAPSVAVGQSGAAARRAPEPAAARNLVQQPPGQPRAVKPTGPASLGGQAAAASGQVSPPATSRGVASAGAAGAGPGPVSTGSDVGGDASDRTEAASGVEGGEAQLQGPRGGGRQQPGALQRPPARRQQGARAPNQSRAGQVGPQTPLPKPTLQS